MNKNIMSYVKKLTAGVLAVGMIVAGIVVAPKQADAAVADDVVVYEELNIATYWNDGKKAPVKEGYVFGGWFTDAPTETVDNEETLYLSTDTTQSKRCMPLTATAIDSNGDNLVDDGVTAYAKFVPAQVLSVKAQNQSGVDADYISNLNKDWVEGQEKDYFWVRVMTSLDSKNYAKIGFDIHLANKEEGLTQEDGSALETTKIYEAVMEEVNGTQEVSTAEEIFGGASDYVCVWQLSKIDTPSNAEKIIYVRPYWYTMDGTKVLGLAKYVHIEDEYLNYISVPVNLLGGEKVAAGAVNVTYSTGDNAALQLIGFEAGRILPQMNHNYTDKTIKMVGNTDKAVNSFNEGETIYANLRFSKPTADTEFNITYGQFCDWSEEILTEMKKVWDTKYVKETTSE